MRAFKIVSVFLCCVPVFTYAALCRPAEKARLRVVNEEVTCKAADCFEAVSHYQALYEGRKRIARVGEYSISPSGDYAAYSVYTAEDAKIMLYKRGTGKAKNVTDGKFAIPDNFKWNEKNSTLTITYYHRPQTKKRPDTKIKFKQFWAEPRKH